MTAPIIIHGNWEDNYDDPAHPIPSVTALDIHAVKKNGGSDLVIIIASPLGGDERSQHRLLEKISLYLKFVSTEEYRAQCGVATPENTSIIVRIHQGSDPIVFALLSRYEPLVHEHGVTLLVTPLE